MKPFWVGKLSGCGFGSARRVRFDAVLVRQGEAAAVLGRLIKRLRFWFRKTSYCITVSYGITAAVLGRQVKRLRFWFRKTCMLFWFGRLKPFWVGR